MSDTIIMMYDLEDLILYCIAKSSFGFSYLRYQSVYIIASYNIIIIHTYCFTAACKVECSYVDRYMSSVRDTDMQEGKVTYLHENNRVRLVR